MKAYQDTTGLILISSYAGVNCAWALFLWIWVPISSFTDGDPATSFTGDWLQLWAIIAFVSHAFVATLGGLIAFLVTLLAFRTLGRPMHRLQRKCRLLGPISFTVSGALLGTCLWIIGYISGLTTGLGSIHRVDLFLVLAGALTGFFFWYFKRRALARLTPVQQ